MYNESFAFVVYVLYLKTRFKKINRICEEPGNDSGTSSGHQHMERTQRLGWIFTASHGLVAGKVKTKGRNLSGDGDVQSAENASDSFRLPYLTNAVHWPPD
jgi:hypothetical protein